MKILGLHKLNTANTSLLQKHAYSKILNIKKKKKKNLKVSDKNSDIFHIFA